MLILFGKEGKTESENFPRKNLKTVKQKDIHTIPRAKA